MSTIAQTTTTIAERLGEPPTTSPADIAPAIQPEGLAEQITPLPAAPHVATTLPDPTNGCTTLVTADPQPGDVPLTGSPWWCRPSLPGTGFPALLVCLWAAGISALGALALWSARPFKRVRVFPEGL